MLKRRRNKKQRLLKLMPMLDPKIFMVTGETRFWYVTNFFLSLALTDTHAHARTHTHTHTHTYAKDRYRSPK